MIEKETSHLFMWFSDGSKIPPGVSPLPHNARLDYISRLKKECAKLLLTKTPVYLVYMGRLINEEQKKLLEDLQNQIPNLAVIDYDEVEQHISDQQVRDKVALVATAYKQDQKLDVGIGGIADVVDLTRLVLLYNSDILRAIAQKKITTPLEWRNGLIYRDFDVTLEKDSMPDIPTKYGYMATLNLLAQAHQHQRLLIEKANGNEDLIQRINVFFNTYIYNLDHYHRVLYLFLRRDLTDTEGNEKQHILQEYDTISSKRTSFIFALIYLIQIENSFLAFNQDKHPLLKKMIDETVCRGGDSPYAVLLSNFRRAIGRLESLQEFLTPQQLGFNIGNDLTWKMSVEEQQLEGNSTIASTPQEPKQVDEASAAAEAAATDHPENQEKVDKLSILSKNYLSHLNKTSNKTQRKFREKYDILLTLNAILEHPSLPASTKLSEFYNRLQKADKEVLKNHREPKWVIFKKAALFLLGITVVGAIAGLIDYAIRGHHSIFCAPKSHGERYVLDVEEYRQPMNVI